MNIFTFMINKKIKKTYFICKDLITGELYLEKSIEYDFQGNVVDYIKYNRDGEQTIRSITERYKNKITSETRYYKSDLFKFYYAYDEYIYNENDLLTMKVSFCRNEVIRKGDICDESSYGKPWTSENIEKNASIIIFDYKYDGKNRLIWERSYYTDKENFEFVLIYSYDEDNLSTRKYYIGGDSEPFTTRTLWSNNKRDKISNHYDNDGNLFRTEHAVYNSDGSIIINDEMINRESSDRHVYYYDKAGNLLEDNCINDSNNTFTRRINEYDQYTGLLKRYTEYVMEKGLHKISAQIEFEFVNEYFPWD